jgi:DNA-directed RNA polymerase subunit RPC12/RpoP
MNKCILCDKNFKQLQGRNRKRCNNCNTKIRRLRTKIAAIEYLGGKCLRCGYNKHPAAMEFHHRENKDFMISNVANRKWEIVKKELDKCDLLCSNCHRIEHSDRFDNLALLENAKAYKGRLLK